MNSRLVVVNCFQNCILVDYSQVHLCLIKWSFVVNCFQNCILVDYSQATHPLDATARRCELLSELYFS